MRVLVTGNSKPWKVGAGIERALRRAGHATLLLDDRKLKRRIGWSLTQRWALRAVRRFKPEHVILDKCHALDYETVASIVRDVPSSMWYHDPAWVQQPEEPVVAHISSVAGMAQHFFVTGFDKEWRAHGVPAKFLPAAGDREIVPVASDAAFGAPVSFIGTGYAADRAHFLARLGKHVKLRVWGAGWEKWRAELDWSGRKAEQDDFARVCSSSGVMLGLNPAIAQGATNWVSNRMWLTILAGGFYLGEGTPGVDELLRDGEHCAYYRDFESCVAQIERYLSDPAARERIRRAGESFVRAHHTFDARIANLLSGRAFENPLA